MVLAMELMSQSFVFRNGEPSNANRRAVLAAQVWLYDQATHFFVAEHDNKLIGFAVIKLGVDCPAGASSNIELQTLFVQEHHIGHSVGKLLLQAAQAKASKQPESALWLKVNANNGRAINFYAHHGYTKVGTAYFELGEGRYENHMLIGRGA
jgi:diamine N-acetyltransferase